MITSELVLNFLILATAVFVLIRAGVFVVRSLIRMAHFLNVSEFALAFILMSFATTLPEFAIGLNSAFSGEPLISLGNIFGANILNLSLVLGLVVLISKSSLVIDRSSPSHHHKTWITFFIGISPVILLLDLELSRLDGLILIILFFLYLARLFHLKEIFEHRKSFWISFINHFERRADGLNLKYFFKNLLVFIASVGVVLVSAFFVVNSAETISLKIGISEMLIGIFIIALGTTLPELSFGIRAALRKHEGLSLGNLFGATAFNSTWILGLVALISPIKIVDSTSFWISAAAMVLVLFLANLFLRTRDLISRREGTVLISVYVLFVIVQIIF
ncbi:MAG: hypothetical protein V3T98_02450 [Candidatus Paceibacterota bacterium]